MKLLDLFRPVQRLLKSPLSIAVLTTGLILTCGTVIAQTPTTGWYFNQQSMPNRITLNGVQYTGECSSGPLYPDLTATFLSQKIPPTPYTRVVVKNITPGISTNPNPYTDREYDERRPTSETTKMSFARSHQQRSFSVLEGNNTFEYTIKQRDNILETGTFNAEIQTTLREEERKATWQKSKVCANSSVALNVCADIRNQRAYQCSDGRILESYRDNDDSEITTRIFNKTGQTISFTISGEDYTLSPGRSTNLTSSNSSTSPRLKFNPTCPTCDDLTSSVYLTPGKRYKFTTSGSKSIRLEDYPRD